MCVQASRVEPRIYVPCITDGNVRDFLYSEIFLARGTCKKGGAEWKR